MQFKSFKAVSLDHRFRSIRAVLGSSKDPIVIHLLSEETKAKLSSKCSSPEVLKEVVKVMRNIDTHRHNVSRASLKLHVGSRSIASPLSYNVNHS